MTVGIMMVGIIILCPYNLYNVGVEHRSTHSILVIKMRIKNYLPDCFFLMAIPERPAKIVPIMVKGSGTGVRSNLCRGVIAL